VSQQTIVAVAMTLAVVAVILVVVLLWPLYVEAMPLSRERVCPRTRIIVMRFADNCFARQHQRRADNCLAPYTEFSAKQFLAERPPASTQLLRRAAETDPEAASLL
jgi:hypothetical protein